MYSKVNTMAILGIDGMSVSAEVDVSSGLPEFSLVGYLSSEVKEARERVKISLKNSGFRLEPRRITVNLAPADVRKEGTGFDLAIAVGILASYGLISFRCAEIGCISWGTWSGWSCLPVPGVLPMTLAAVERGFRACYVPDANREEAAVATGIRVIGVSTLETLVAFLNAEDETEALSASVPIETSGEEIYDVDFSEVNGQETMRRAAEVAAAGMHQSVDDGNARFREDNDCKADSDHSSGTYQRRKPGSYQSLQCVRTASARMLSDADPSVPRAASYGICSRTGGRRTATASGRDFAGTPRCTFSG